VAAGDETHSRIYHRAVCRHDNRWPRGAPVETIGSRFGGIPRGLPSFSLPAFSPELVELLLPSAITVAFLAAVESLLSAVVADGMIHDRHDSNVELVAQGVANIASPLFGGIPATGAIARTATNVRSGAKTPVAGMIHALSLLAILLVAAPLARFVPLGTLAAVLFVVAYNMANGAKFHPCFDSRRQISPYGSRRLP
jgi:SulP family sulfate permease